MGAHQQKMMGKVALLFVVAIAGANATACPILACGAGAAPAAGCYCGSARVLVTSGKFCDTTWGTTGQALDTAACIANVLDGTTATVAACSCGNANLQISAGGYTFLKTADKTCAAQGSAAKSNCPAGAAPAAGCYCGSGQVSVASGKFCDTTWVATGQELTTAACIANVLDGTTGTVAACSCGNANLQITAGKRTYYKSSDKTCVAEFTAAKTVCPAGAAPAAGCFCGTAAVSVASGKFCDTTWVATGQELTTAACIANVLDGTTATVAACSCGNANLQISAGG